MDNNNDVNHIDPYEDGSDGPELAMDTQQDERNRNDTKLPDPKSMSIEFDHRPHDRIHLHPA